MKTDKQPKIRVIEPGPIGWHPKGGLTGGEWVKIVEGDTVLGQGINEDIAWQDTYKRLREETSA